MTGLDAHLAAGVTTLARCWAIERRDGTVFGFTDHDRDLAFDGILFRAGTGLSARALSQTTGLSVDNTEAAGALTDAAVTEADLRAGRFDGAAVRMWLVNWDRPDERALRFRGSLGEVTAAGGAFAAELRGLTEALNRPMGRVYQRACAAILGDRTCGVDLKDPLYVAERAVAAIKEAQRLDWPGFDDYADRWFERGRLTVLTGAAAGLVQVVKSDRLSASGRRVELWEAIRAPLRPGDMVRIEAGCDRTPVSCRTKFANLVNFRGFPHVPGEDWLVAYPVASGANDGGSRGG
jgi:uncharacterized phage protein (TIGR02218 family)